MKYNKEDIIKIKQLIKSDDISNVHIGISLAIYTLGMSVDELIGLIDIDCVELRYPPYGKRTKIFGVLNFGNTSDEDQIKHIIPKCRKVIENYLNNNKQ